MCELLFLDLELQRNCHIMEKKNSIILRSCDAASFRIINIFYYVEPSILIKGSLLV